MRSETIEFMSRLMVLFTCGAAASGCGGFVESDSEVARATIGAGGGALHLDAFSLVVPPHAIDHTVTFAVSHASFDAPNGRAYVLEPADAVFDPAAPATLGVVYDATAYPHPVEVFVATFTGTTWHSLPAAGPVEVGVAHASTTHTGTFGLVHCPAGVCPTSSPDASAGN